METPNTETGDDAGRAVGVQRQVSQLEKARRKARALCEHLHNSDGIGFEPYIKALEAEEVIIEALNKARQAG